MITPRSRFLLRLHTHYREGVLAYSGGLLEQPNYYAEAMEVLSERDLQIRAEIAEKLKRQATR